MAAKPVAPSAQLHSPVDAAELVAALGGDEAIKAYAKQSIALRHLPRRNVHGGIDPKGQDAIYKGMGLKNVLKHAQIFKPMFDAFCLSLVAALSKRGHAAKFVAAAVKSFDSAQAKVNVDYHGDASRLSDAVRGTLLLEGGPTTETIRDAYAVLDQILHAEEELRAADAKFVFMKDRYQNPKGTYRDWLLLVRVAGFTCELQVNLAAAVAIKKKRQHRKYELARMANRALLDAAMRGEPKMVRIILSSKCCDVDCVDSIGFAPLHYAARHGELEMIKALVQTADILKLDGDGKVPLYHASVMGHVEAIELLCTAMEARHSGPPKSVLRGATNEAEISLLPDKGKFSIQSSWMLAKASKRVPEALVTRLHALVGEALSHIDDQMHAAAHSGDARACKMLLDQGAMKRSWRFQPDVGYVGTGMDQAITSGSIAAVKTMLAAGVETFEGDDHYGTVGKHTDFLAAAKDYAERNQAKQLAALLESKALDEIEKADLASVAKVAIQARAFDCCSRLLDFGVSVKDNDAVAAFLALHFASSANAPNHVDMLLQMGLSPNAKDVNGRTPLHIAAAGGFIDVMKLLIAGGADVDAPGKDGWTPALRAGQRGQLLAVRLLAEHGADLTVAATAGYCTVAWIACCNGHIHLVKYLAETSAKGMLKSPSCLGIAKERNPKIFAFIQSLGDG